MEKRRFEKGNRKKMEKSRFSLVMALSHYYSIYTHINSSYINFTLTKFVS